MLSRYVVVAVCLVVMRIVAAIPSVQPHNPSVIVSDPPTRDLFAKKRDILAGLADAASTRQDRYSKSEVKFVATVSIAELQKEVDGLSRQYRETDTKLQELNWKTDII